MIIGAVKVFEIEESTIHGGRYRITVRFQGRVIATFTKDTMEQAERALRLAGYLRTAWVEGPKICLQKDL